MKILNIEDSILPDVVIALGRRAAYYDNLIQHAKSMNSGIDPIWVTQSEALWDLLKQLDNQDGKTETIPFAQPAF